LEVEVTYPVQKVWVKEVRKGREIDGGVGDGENLGVYYM
jgi:hypothetical protein